MKKYFFIGWILFGLMGFQASPVFADDETERIGVYVSGGGVAGYEFEKNTGFAGGGIIRAGYAPTNDLAFYFQFGGHIISGSSAGSSTFMDFMAKGHYYFWRDLYASIGAGLTRADLNATTPDVYNSQSRTGVVIETGVGYEFTLGEHLFAAPEIMFSWHRAGSMNFNTFSAGGFVGAHF